MVGKTFKRAIAKAVALATTATLCAGCFLGAGFAASPSESAANILLDHDTDVLSLVMDSAQESLDEDSYEDLVVSDYEPYLAVYADSDAASEVVGKLYPGSYGEIVTKGDQWTKITSGDVTGYVLSEDVAFGEDAKELAQNIGKKVVKVTVDDLNIRSGSNFYSDIIASGKKDETYRIVPEGSEYDEEADAIYWLEDDTRTQDKDTDEEERTSPSFEEMIEPIDDSAGGQWYRIHLNDIYYGYVYADCVSVENQLEDAVTPEEEAQALKAQSEAAQAQNTAASQSTTDTTNTADTKQTQNTQSTKPQTSQTQASQTQTSQTQAPETQAPQTQAPETQAPETQAPETQAPETQAPSSATADDAYMLASIVYCEAGNQSYEGKLAVANVVLNRVKSPLFPNTISEVIYQSGQFGPVYYGTFQQTLASGPPSDCIQVANDALAGSNNIGDLLFFNNVAPAGASSVTTIGDIVFYTYNY